MNIAVLIIDVQQSLVEEGVWESNQIIKNINKLIEKAVNDEVHLIYIKDKRVKPDGSLHKELRQLPNHTCLEKSYSNSFMKTGLHDLLKTKEIKSLVIAGMQTDYCIDTTCRQAATMGYNVLLVSDAHSTLDNGELKAPQIISHHNKILSTFNSETGKIRLVKEKDICFKDLLAYTE